MRILVVSNLYPPDYLGGYELGCRQVVDALRASGHDILVLTSAPRSRPVPHDPTVLRRLKLVDIYDSYSEAKRSEPEHRARRVEACFVSAFNVYALGEAIEAFRPDVVYVWSVIGIGGLGLLAAIQHVGLPWVMHLMDKVPRELCAMKTEAIPHRALAEQFLRLCRGRFLCCSQTTLDEIAAGGICLDDRTRLVPNWVATAGSPERSDYLPGGHLRIVYSGALEGYKGVDILIHAAGLLRDRGFTNFSVDLYGSGADAAFTGLVRHLGLTDYVRLRGRRTQDELYAIYPRYDLFAFPTCEREPMAFAPLEAAAHGCAVAMSANCGNSEWFLHGVDCLKADRTPVAFADLFEQAIRGEVSVSDIGRRGARTVLREHRFESVLPIIEAELQAAIGLGSGRSRPMAEAVHLALLAEKIFGYLVHETAA